MNHPVDAPDPRVDAVRRAQGVWRSQVSDLGGRNTLLWYRDLPTGTFDLTVAHPGGVAKLLTGTTTRLSELVREQVAFGEARRRVAAIRARTAELKREHGLTTGFIAVGMATWSMRRAPVPPRAPVLLRECAITATDASHTDFTLTIGPEVMFNPLLQRYLEDEVGVSLDVDQLAASSTESAGFDPRPAYTALERACAGLDGFGIGPQMVISTFPWAKLSLVASLSDDPGTLARSALVSALAGADVDLPSVAAPEELGPDADPSVLDSDRAQRSVISAALAGASLVVDGAPGTGRTQTVANVVAECLGRGGTVLVVSEHQPALNDLQRRLGEVELDHLVLPLAETPEGARQVLQALHASLGSLEDGDDPTTSAAETAEQARMALGELRRHEATMHARHAPWGHSLAETEVALTRLATLSRPPVSHVRLSGPALEQLVPDRLDQVRAAMVEAAELGAWERGRTEDPWYAARVADEEDARRAEAIVQHLVSGELTRARGEADGLCDRVGLPRPLTLQQWGRHLDLVARVHETLDVFRPQVYDAPLEELAAALDRAATDRPPAVVRARARRQVRSLLRPGTPPPDLAARVAAARDERRTWESLAGKAARPATAPGWQEAADSFDSLAEDLTWLGKVLRDTPTGQDLESVHLDVLLERLLRLDARVDRLAVASRAHAVLGPLRASGLAPLVDDLAHRGVAAEHVSAEVDLVFWASLLDHVLQSYEGPGHDGDQVRTAVESFALADRALLAANASRVAATAARKARQVVQAEVGQTVALREASSGTSPTRDLLAPVADVARALRPCWLASPLVVPAVVPPGMTFDLVVVDEAARVPLAHAVPALALGDQVLAFGCSTDPGTSPFVTVVDERAEATTPDSRARSVLAALGEHLPTRVLDTSYRTIDDRLLAPLGDTVHPVPTHGFPGVLRTPRVTHAATGTWHEALAATAELVLQHAEVTPWMSLAVVAADRASLEDVDRALRATIAARGKGRAFRDDAVEGLLLSTADRMAVEVRDRVLLTLEAGALPPADHVGHSLAAARRAVTLVVAGPENSWPASPTSDLLRRALHLGAARVTATGPSSDGDASPLLQDLARRLRAEGLSVRTCFGSGPHAVELAIDDPQDTGRPLVAVRTDSSPGSLADRDAARLVDEQLRRLGWAPVRIWCTDLFRDPAREVARILALTREASAARARR